jgi:pimeloyl-ACP methyl ester carboxylesterase
LLLFLVRFYRIFDVQPPPGNTTSRRAVVFIHGLTEGPLACNYLPLLSSKLEPEYALLQPVLGSSFSQYGTTNLHTDAIELDSLLSSAQETFGFEEFLLLGFSTGCQDTIHFLKHGKKRDNISRIILHSPVSDRQWSEMRDPKLQSRLTEAKFQRDQGNAKQVAPSDWDEHGTPITFERFLSLNERMGEEDCFSTDLSDAELKEKVGHVNVPTMAIIGSEDEFVQAGLDVNAHLKRVLGAMETNESVVVVIDGGKHALDSSVDICESFVDNVIKWVKIVE